MSDQDLTRIARDIVNSYNTADWKLLKSILTPDALYNELGTQRQVKGPDQIVKTLQGWKQAMSDSDGKVTNVFVSGPNATLEITWQGTHDGPFTGPGGTLPASGRRQTTSAAMVVKFQGDKVKEIHHYFDMMSFLQQIGAMSAARA